MDRARQMAGGASARAADARCMTLIVRGHCMRAATCVRAAAPLLVWMRVPSHQLLGGPLVPSSPAQFPACLSGLPDGIHPCIVCVIVTLAAIALAACPRRRRNAGGLLVSCGPVESGRTSI